MTVIGVIGPYSSLSGKRTTCKADFFHLLHALKNTVLDSALFCSFLFQLPTEMSSVYITGIRRTVCVRIILIGIIIELTNLISAVDNRNAGLNKQIGVEHQNFLNGTLNSRRVLCLQRSLQTAQGCRRSAKSRILQYRIIIIQLAPRIAACCHAPEIFIQILLMRNLLNTGGF